MGSDIAITAMRLQAESCDVRNCVGLRVSQNAAMTKPLFNRSLIVPRLKELGKNQAGLARHLGISAEKVNKIVVGARKVQAEELPAFLEYLEWSPQETIKSQRYMPLSPIDPRDKVPVMGTSQGGRDGGWSLFNGEAIDYVARPPSLANAPHGYATYVSGTSMEPRYFEGELIYVHPGRPVTIGSFVVVQLKQKQDGEAPPAIIKRLVKKTPTKYVLEQLSPPKTFDVAIDEVHSMHKIVGSGE